MSYQKYQTETVVLRNYERGEADRVFGLLTKAFGFVWARASAVRREKSKMRYALQNFALAEISLIRGSSGWRVAGARSMVHMESSNVSGISAFARVAHLVERLSAGEERNDYLFDVLTEAHAALLSEPKERHGAVELLCVARVLYALGYVSAEALGTALFTHAAYELPALTEVEASRSKLLSSVNRALSQAHL